MIEYTFEVDTSNDYKDKYIQILVFCISIILGCKLLFIKDLNLVPGHKLIIARILGNNYYRTLTILIELSEFIMPIVIKSTFKTG